MGFSALTNSVSGPSRLDGIGFAAGLGSACGGGLSELEDCDSAAVAFGGGAEGAGLAFGGGEGYGCGGALYPGLLTLGRGNVGSGTGNRYPTRHLTMGGSGGHWPSPNFNTFFQLPAATCAPGCPPPA